VFPALALGFKPMEFDAKGNKLIVIICFISHTIPIRLKTSYAYLPVKFKDIAWVVDLISVEVFDRITQYKTIVITSRDD